MKSLLKMTTAAAALAGSALFCAPANAAYVGIGVGPVGFDIYSGGYCDRWGCPNDYWTYPIFYGPVYYDNAWYRGPVYYRTTNGERWYWVHGAWHRDQWRGPRPGWAREVRYGPPRGLDYYREHGFRVRDEDWRAWADRDDRYRAGYRDQGQGGYYGNEERYPDQDRYRDYDMNRDRGYDRDTDTDRGNDRDYDRDRGTYEHSGYDRDQYTGRGDENGAGYDRDRGYSGYDRDRADQRSDYDRGRNAYERSDYDRDRDRGMYERSDYERSGGASGSGHMTHATSHHTTHGTYHHHTINQPPDRDRDHGYMHTQYEREPGRMDQDRMRSDMDRTRPDDQTRDRGNIDANDKSGDQSRDRDRSPGTENGYEKTQYQQPVGEHGHVKPPPPSHATAKPKSNPDGENNGPSD